MNSMFFGLPNGLQLDDLLERLRYLSWGAAEILLAYEDGSQPPYGFSKSLEILEQPDGPVTAADLSVNDWLVNGLKKYFENINWQIFSEESVKNKPFEKSKNLSEWIWILDPLDGTKDFLSGSGDYAVHLCLLRRNSPFLGVVLIPKREEMWIGIEGIGSWRENKSGKKIDFSFSSRRNCENLILVSSRNHRNEKLDYLVDNLSLGGSMKVGSVGCKIASILKGEADIYISLSGKTSPKDWDMAAPEAVLKFAGGSFSHEDISPLNYDKDDFLQSGCIVASHGYSHKTICTKVNYLLNKYK